MFTGLVTDVGQVRSREDLGDVRLVLGTGYDVSKIDTGASIACNGICLTVVDKGRDDKGNWFAVDASQETCRVTNLGDWQVGTAVNFEKSLRLGDEMGGHIVSGHVDTKGKLVGLEGVGDSVRMDIAVPAEFGHLLAAKGSVAVDGISLTVNTVEDTETETIFSLNIIPHTQEVTSLRSVTLGQDMNIEFDLLARYTARLRERG